MELNIILFQLMMLYLIWYKINIMDRLTEAVAVDYENIYNRTWFVW